MPNHIFVYGTLRKDQHANKLFGVEACAEYVSTTTLPGSLYDLGAFPGYIPGEEGKVTGDVYELKDRSIISDLDRYEGFDIRHPQQSLYIRRTAVCEDGTEVFVYVYNNPVNVVHRIPSGDWLVE